MKLRLQSNKDIKYSNFNGIKILDSVYALKEFRSGYPSEVKMVNCLAARSSRMIPQGHVSGDRIAFHRNGTIRIEDYQFTISKSALMQVLSYLGIPLNFSKRIPKELLIQNINSLMSDNFTSTFTIKYITISNNRIITAFYPEKKVSYPTRFAMYKGTTNIKDKVFHGGMLKDLDMTLYYTFKEGGEENENPVHGGFELKFSSSGNFLPTITPFVVSNHLLALFSNASVALDMNKIGMRCPSELITPVVLSIRESIKKYVKMAENAYVKTLPMESYIRLCLFGDKLTGPEKVFAPDANDTAANVMDKLLKIKTTHDYKHRAVKLCGSILNESF